MGDGRVTAVIVAAGRGRRVAALGLDLPKVLLPVGNVPLLEHQLRMFTAAGVTDVIVVVGPNGAHLESEFGAHRAGCSLRYVSQREPLGIAHAVARAGPFVGEACVVLLGDSFVRVGSLGAIIEPILDGRAEAVLASPASWTTETASAEFKLVFGPDGLVRAIQERPGKGCVLYGFHRSAFEAIERAPRSPLRGEHELADGLQILIDGGGRVLVEPCLTQDFNVNTPADLLRCNMEYLLDRGYSTLVAPDAVIDPAARVERSVVGPRAKVSGAVRVVGSLVLANTSVSSDLIDGIATQRGVIQGVG